MFTRKGYATSVSGKTANGCPVRSAKPPDNMNFHYISPSADGETLRGFNTQKGKAYRLPFLFCYCRIKQRKFFQDAQPVLVEGLPGCLKIGRKRFAVYRLPICQRPIDRAATTKRPCAIRRLFRHAAAFTIRMPHLFCCHYLLLMCSEAAPRRCRAVRLFPPAPACSASRFQKACLRSRP